LVDLPTAVERRRNAYRNFEKAMLYVADVEEVRLNKKNRMTFGKLPKL